MLTIGSYINEQNEVACFPPWPRDWCKAKGATPPPPWGENENRGDQSAGAALPSGAQWLMVGAVALLVFWLSVRALEAYATLRD